MIGTYDHDETAVRCATSELPPHLHLHFISVHYDCADSVFLLLKFCKNEFIRNYLVLYTNLWRIYKNCFDKDIKSLKSWESSAFSLIRAVDPHSFYAEPDPAIFLNADPDPDPGGKMNADPAEQML